MVSRIRWKATDGFLFALLILLGISLLGPPATAAIARLPAPQVVSETGPVVEAEAPEDIWYHVDADGEPIVHLWFGFSSTCPHCRAALPYVQKLAEEPWLDVLWLQVDGADADRAVGTLAALADLIGEQWQAVPAFFYGGRMRVGWTDDNTTGSQLRSELTAYHAALVADRATAAPPAAADTTVSMPFGNEIDAASVSLPILAIVLGGLDAFNPCALAVLLFLLSVLAGSRDRKRMLLIGGLFVAVSGIVYFALMVAWLNVFMVLGALRWVTLIAGIAAVVVAMINLKDHVWFRRGVSLTMPESSRPQIFGRLINVSEETRLRVLVGTTILVAAVANMYEMICTGGFPVVFTRVLTLNELPTIAYYAYVGLYCLVYVVPAVLIVLVFTLTLGARGVSVREARDLKLLSGLLMLGFGGLLLFAPDQMSDLGVTIGLFAGAIGAWLVVMLVERFVAHRRPLAHHT